MKEIKIYIDGMHCEGCSSRIEKALKNIEEIEEVNVKLENKNAIIKFDESKINIEKIIQTIEEIGFKGRI